VLPDFLDIKRQIAADRINDLRAAERADSIFSLFSHFRQHEGDRFTIVQEDQTARTSRYRHFEVEGTLKVDDLLSSGTQAIRDMLATMAEGLSKEQVHMFQSMMDQATNEAGTVVHADGRPFSAELFIEAIDKMELSFDDNGDWEMPTLVGHPMHEARIKAELARIDNTPELHAKATAIVNRKREAWRVREAHRTLVD
jgi:hypothetical protein